MSGIHPFFENLRKNVFYVENRARVWRFFGCEPGFFYEFSSVFPVFFQKKFSPAVQSWFHAISTSFPLEQEQYITRYSINEVQNLGLIDNVNRPENRHVACFWVWLKWVYKQLKQQRRPPRIDRIFGFFSGFPIEETRIVFVGHEPHPEFESDGFAFHGVNCPSTRNLLNIALNEHDVLENLILSSFGEYPFNLAEIRQSMVKCRMDGWIRQGVLLMNMLLTYEHPNRRNNGYWRTFTGFVLDYLSQYSKQSLVFVLYGKEASDASIYIKENRHLVIKTYHPAWYSAPKAERAFMHWRFTMPFINSNFFLYQKGLSLIDWNGVETGMRNTTSISLIKFYKFMMELAVMHCGRPFFHGRRVEAIDQDFARNVCIGFQWDMTFQYVRLTSFDPCPECTGFVQF